MKKILILGAGVWQIPYLRKAKELGYCVCSVDWSPTPAGIEFVDVFENISVRDKEKVLSFANKNKIDAILSNTDIGVPIAAYVAEKMQLPCYTPQQAEIATNKYVMRNFIKSIGLPVPEYYLCVSKSELFENYKKMNKKVIIKPVDNSGSQGVYVVENECELEKIAGDTFNKSFSNQVLIEEFVVGIESSVEVVVNQRKPEVLGWCFKKNSPEPYRFDIQLDYFPDFSLKLHEQVNEMVTQLVSGLQYENGILHIEFMWTSFGIMIIEFALRGCGINVITHMMPIIRGFDVVKFLIEKSFGNESTINLSTNLFGTLKFIIPNKGVVKSIQGIDEINRLNNVVLFHTDITQGYQVGEIKNGCQRPGYYILSGRSRKDILDTIDDVEKLLQIKYYG